MPLKEMRLELDFDRMFFSLEKSTYDLLVIFLGWWFHPFLTLKRLINRTTPISAFLSLSLTLSLLWLAQLIRHPQTIGWWPRLLIWQRMGWLVVTLGLIVVIIGLLYPSHWRRVLSLTLFLPIPGLWLVGRSLWIRLLSLSSRWSSLINFLFLDLTIYFFLFQLIIFYLWLRLIAGQKPFFSLLILVLAGGWFYLVKQFICLWF